MPRSFVLAAAASGTVVLAGIGSAAAQPIVVEDWYAPPPVYVAPAPVYAAPVIVAPAPRLYVAPARGYPERIVRTRRVTREVIVREPGWDW
jgi:hypothetical protein